MQNRTMLNSAISLDAAIGLDAVGAIYADHHHWLVGWLRKKLGSSHQADDLAHDTFVRLLALPDIASLQTPKAYLTTTATHLIIDAARRHKLEQAYLQTMALLHADLHDYSPEHYQQAIETLNAIAQLLEGLPEKARRAFLLSRLEELPHADIAVQLGVSVSMVKQYIARAMVHCYTAIYPL